MQGFLLTLAEVKRNTDIVLINISLKKINKLIQSNTEYSTDQSIQISFWEII